MRYALALLLCGCFTDAKPAPPPTATHTCASASAKLAEVLRAGHEGEPGDVKAFVAAIERTCNEDKWPVEALTCIDGAASHETMQQCGHDHLTADQMQHVEDAAKAAHAPHYAKTLAVTSIDPAIGDPDGGTYVKISGAAFLADGPRNLKVYFGTHQGSVVRFSSDTELIVQAPGGKPGEVVDVLLVFAPGGELKLPQGFRYK